jgi:hypothetical protein
MKLNADIIFDNLSQSVAVESFGRHDQKLSLQRPVFKNDLSCEFAADHVYVALTDWLPADPAFGKRVVIICAGGEPPGKYTTGKCVCFLIKDETDIFSVFNAVQRIFNKFGEWDRGLQRVINGAGDIGEILELSFPVIENPMVVFDADYHYAAYTDVINKHDALEIYRPDHNGYVKLDLIRDSREYYEIPFSNAEPALICILGVQYFVVNYYDHKRNFSGNLSIPLLLRQQRPSDIVLIRHLAKIVETAFDKYSARLDGSMDNLKSVFMDLISGEPLDSVRKKYLEKGIYQGLYLCMIMRLKQPSSDKIPTGYIHHTIENSFKGGCAVFEAENSIVSYFDLRKLSLDEKTLIDKAADILWTMNLKAGVSNSFTNLSIARLYYRQACVAFDIGSIVQPDTDCYLFTDFAPRYMVSQCTGEFPLELLYSKGFCQLLEHDVSSEISYIHTLRTYLNNNMNITKTAKALFLHRSTLIERLRHIKRALHGELECPDQRLRLQIIFKIMEINQIDCTRADAVAQRYFLFTPSLTTSPNKT